MPLGSLQEPAKSLPRASPDRPRALKRLSTAFKSLPSGPQENSKSLLYRPAYSLGQIITIIDQWRSSPASASLIVDRRNRWSLDVDWTSTTKDRCTHGGGPTRQRSWIYIYIYIYIYIFIYIYIYIYWYIYIYIYMTNMRVQLWGRMSIPRSTAS